jgi:hypothetical protein
MELQHKATSCFLTLAWRFIKVSTEFITSGWLITWLQSAPCRRDNLNLTGWSKENFGVQAQEILAHENT